MSKTPANAVADLYGNRVRVRACGVFISDNKLLLVNHTLYGSGTSFWNVPGGGVEFGEPATVALQREFEEETGLLVRVGELLFVNEFINPPLHAIEMFFKIESADGNLKKGRDPEFSDNGQILKEVRFLSISELEQIPNSNRHGLLKNIKSFHEIFVLKGYRVFE